jgi:hypothetical protein
VKPSHLRLGIFVLILIAVIFRLPIFFLSHFNNDELIHLSLAMKIEEYGLDVFKDKKYNLFYVDRGVSPDLSLVGIWEGKNEEGLLLSGFLGERETLSHHPPLLPLFLSLSHKLFANNAIYLANISRNLYLMLRNSLSQFYACLTQFSASVFFILSVFLLGSLLFSKKIGLICALFVSLTPTELMTANKIWADDMTAFFVTLSVICYLYALKNNKPFFSLLAGFSCGLSILTKMSGVYLIFAMLLFHVFEHRKDKVTVNNIIAFLWDKNILYFLAGAFIASAWWFDLYYSSFDIRSSGGYFAVNEKWETAKTWNAYFNIASNRPWYSYFILVPYQFPLYLISYLFIVLFALKRWVRKFADLIKKEDNRYLIFLIIWVSTVFTFLTLKPGKEERYMLIAYPAISILSVYSLNLFYQWFKNKELGISLNLKRTLFISIILLSLFFSLKIALPRILFRADIIPIPL